MILYVDSEDVNVSVFVATFLGIFGQYFQFFIIMPLSCPEEVFVFVQVGTMGFFQKLTLS